MEFLGHEDGEVEDTRQVRLDVHLIQWEPQIIIDITDTMDLKLKAIAGPDV